MGKLFGQNITFMGRLGIGSAPDPNAPLYLFSGSRYMFPMMSDPTVNRSGHSEIFHGFYPGGSYNAIALDFSCTALDSPDNFLSIHMYGDGPGSGLAVFGTDGDGSNVAIGLDGRRPKAKLHASVSTILGAATAAAPDGDLGAGEVSVWIDEVANKLMFKVRYSDDVTIKTGSISLAP